MRKRTRKLSSPTTTNRDVVIAESADARRRACIRNAAGTCESSADRTAEGSSLSRGWIQRHASAGCATRSTRASGYQPRTSASAQCVGDATYSPRDWWAEDIPPDVTPADCVDVGASPYSLFYDGREAHSFDPEGIMGGTRLGGSLYELPSESRQFPLPTDTRWPFFHRSSGLLSGASLP